MATSGEVDYLVVNNIPSRFRSADLRNYFSQFIESDGFVCFHYRHRPELRVPSATEVDQDTVADGSDVSAGEKRPVSCCCVVSVRARDSQRLMKMFTGNHWIDSSGNWLKRKCLIRRVRVSEECEPDSFPYKTKTEMRRHVVQSDHFSLNDLRVLSELNPPALMPSGNVGTPIRVFLQLIQSCRLPPRLIKKLGLTFPKTSCNRRYGNVPYQYKNTTVMTPDEESVFTAGGVEISGPDTATFHCNTHYPEQSTLTPSHNMPTTSRITLDTHATSKQDMATEEASSPSEIAQSVLKSSQDNNHDMLTQTITDMPTPTPTRQYTASNQQLFTTSQTQETGLTSEDLEEIPTNPLQHMQTTDDLQDTHTVSTQKTLTNSQTMNDMHANSETEPNQPTTSESSKAKTSRKAFNVPRSHKDPPHPPVNHVSVDEESDEELSGPDDDDDRCEEWERHEALHEDVTSQERSKERLFEERIELKWEKGGSGLVFYTDAQFWQEEEEGDFDEQTADDWDVDMSIYYDKDGGDMDARDFIRMRSEKRLRDGVDKLKGMQQRIGRFERFTKGFGRRVMEQQGWRDGQGLGSSSVGIKEALENEGQHPHSRRGFGYHGEKLSSFLPQKKPRKDFHISTIYDEPKDIDEGDELLRRQPNTSMKLRRFKK